MMYVITYDIVQDRRRNKISKVLQDYGLRVQYSVFEADNDRQHTDEMMHRLKGLLDTETDSVNFYCLCQQCAQKVIRVGRNRNVDFYNGIIL